MLNVRRAVRDKRLTQKVVRIVSTESVNAYGEPEQAYQRSTVRAIVTVASQGDIERYVDATLYHKAILVTSEMIFYPDNLTGQPDIIVYHNENYVVLGVDDYRDFGYTRAVCGITDFQAAASGGNYTARSSDGV
jgi:hypothetical protein